PRFCSAVAHFPRLYGERPSSKTTHPVRPSTALADDCTDRHHVGSRKVHCLSCGLSQQSALCELQRRQDSSSLFERGRSYPVPTFSIAYNGGNRFLFSLMLDADSSSMAL